MTPTDDLTHLYQRMLRIRRVEERLRDLFAAGKLPGFLHLSIGQEAVAVGICDPVSYTHLTLPTNREV